MGDILVPDAVLNSAGTLSSSIWLLIPLGATVPADSRFKRRSLQEPFFHFDPDFPYFSTQHRGGNSPLTLLLVYAVDTISEVLVTRFMLGLLGQDLEFRKRKCSKMKLMKLMKVSKIMLPMPQCKMCETYGKSAKCTV